MNTYRKTVAGRRRRLRTYVKKVGAIFGTASLASAAFVSTSSQPAQAAAPTTYSFTTPGSSTWNVPAGVETVHITVRGGSGGNDDGGAGGVVSGFLDVSNLSALSLTIAGRGGDGEYGGGSNSWGSGGYGYGSGGDGGTGSVSPIIPSLSQGGGGGGGASAVFADGTRLVIAGGGGGGGGDAVCGGNPGGNADQNGWKYNNSCASNGGDPGRTDASGSYNGAGGENAGSSSGQGGGGGGGGGYWGGSGADASTDGGGGGGGGMSYCALSGCSTSASNWGNGSITIRAVHTPVVSFDDDSYSAYTGTNATFSGTVLTQSADGGIPEGVVQLGAKAASGETQEIGSVSLDNQGKFTYTCTAPCGVDLEDVTEIQATYVSSEPSNWANADGLAPLTFVKGQTQTGLFIDPTQAVTGQLRDFTATVSVLQPASGVVTGEVEFWMSNLDNTGPELLGTADLAANYQAALVAGVPEATTKRFWAVYLGNTGFEGSQSPKQTLDTIPAQTEVTALTNPHPSVTGQEFDQHITVAVLAPGAGTPTGEVQIVSEFGQYTATLDATGEATVHIDGQMVGEYDITVNYLGDENFEPSSTTITHEVERAGVDLDLALDAAESTYGESVMLQATAAVIAPGQGEVTGDVQFGYLDEDDEFVAIDEPVQLEAGIAELSLDGLDAGVYEFQAWYAQTPNFLEAYSPKVTHEILPAESTVIATPLPDHNTYGLPQRVNIAVVGPAGDDGAALPAQGEVQLIRILPDGTEEPLSQSISLDDAGEAEVNLDWSDPGDYEVYAIYDGSNNHLAGSSPAAEFTIEKATPGITLTGANQVTVGEESTFTVHVSPFALLGAPDEGNALLRLPAGNDMVALDFIPTGAVTFFIDGETVETDVDLVPNPDGSMSAVATFTHLFASVGTFDLTASYGGDTYVLAGATDEGVQVEVAAKPVEKPDRGPVHGGGELVRTGSGGVADGLTAAAVMTLAGLLMVVRVRTRQSN